MCILLVYNLIFDFSVCFSVGVHVRGCGMRLAGAACGKKFNYYSFGGSASMYTACGYGLQVRVAACGSFGSGIEFCHKPQATASSIGHFF